MTAKQGTRQDKAATFTNGWLCTQKSEAGDITGKTTLLINRTALCQA